MKKLTIFLQPTFDCALNCRGCYVKESVQGKQLSLETLKSYLRYLWTTNKYIVEQLTIAVDNLPKSGEARAIMLGVVEEAIRLKKTGLNKRTELHFTVNSLQALEEYADAGVLKLTDLRYLDLLSVSHLVSDDEIPLFMIRQLTKVNYNYIPEKNLSSYRRMLEHVDMSYFILHKAGLGRTNDPTMITRYKEALKTIKKWTPSEQSKINIDRCVQDTFKYLKTGYGCAANVSRIHTWPDGHTTGCPYNREGGKTAKNLSEILVGIDSAWSRYEFHSCTIPQDFTISPMGRLVILQ